MYLHMYVSHEENANSRYRRKKKESAIDSVAPSIQIVLLPGWFLPYGVAMPST